MAKGSCGTKSPASQLLNRDHKLSGIPKEMGKRSGDSTKSSDHASSEREYERTKVR